MAIKVTLPSSSSVTTKVSSTTPSTRIGVVSTTQSKTQTATSLSGLQGIDVTGVQDGYTLVYDSGTGNWEAAPASDVAANVQNLDGGTY